MNPLVSVVIITYNRCEMVTRCVTSVLASDYEPFEVIVVDDCSPDGTAAHLRTKFAKDARVRVVRNEKNLLSAGSRNHGARIAKGEFVFFMDDDNILAPDAIRHLVNGFATDERLGFLAPVTVNQMGDKTGLIWTLGADYNHWTSRAQDYGAGTPIKDFVPEMEIYPTTYSPNAFMVRRQALADVGGGIDESFGMMFDEADFGVRVGEAGWKEGICARAITDHYGTLEEGINPVLRNLGIEKPRRTYCFGRNRLWFAKRHFSFLQALSVMFIFAPIIAVYYGLIALRQRRPDIAFAYLRGTIVGFFTRAPKRMDKVIEPQR